MNLTITTKIKLEKLLMKKENVIFISKMLFSKKKAQLAGKKEGIEIRCTTVHIETLNPQNIGEHEIWKK